MSTAAALPPFETLVSAHGACVLRVARGLVGVVDADDIWQETFLAALRVYPSSTNVHNWEAWLVSIARNKSIDHHRKAIRLPIPMNNPLDGFGSIAGASRDGRPPDASPVGSPRPSGGASGDNGCDSVVRAVEAGEAATEVWAALAKLPPTQREAVVYHHLAGLRHAVVAELLGNSEAASRRASADGMKTLRTLLSPPETSATGRKG